jgi:hypothetical protein
MSDQTAGFALHRRIVQQLESNVRTRDWWVWIEFHLDDETDVSLNGLADAVEEWLGEADADEQLEQPDRIRELKWDGGGIHVQLRAIPRGVNTRGLPELIGNPFPAFAYFVGS